MIYERPPHARRRALASPGSRRCRLRRRRPGCLLRPAPRERPRRRMPSDCRPRPCARTARAFAGICPCTMTRGEPGRRFSVSMPVPDSATVVSWLSICSPPPSGRTSMKTGSPAAAPARMTRSTEPSLYSSALTACCITVRQVVERPPVPKPVVVEEIVVADDAAFHARDTGLAHLARKGSQGARRLAALADARIAASDDDQVAAQHALIDGSNRDDLRFELMLPSEQLGCRSHRHHLHHRTRHHQLCRVQRVQILPPARRARRARSRRTVRTAVFRKWRRDRPAVAGPERCSLREAPGRPRLPWKVRTPDTASAAARAMAARVTPSSY